MSPLAQARLADVRAKKYQPWLSRPGGLPFDSARYQDKILRMFGGSIVAYWPLDDVSGTIARDVSGRQYNGAYSGPTLGQPGMGEDGSLSALFDGNNDVVNVLSTGFASPNGGFSGRTGGYCCWCKNLAPGDLTGRNIFVVSDTAGRNILQIRKLNTVANTLRVNYKSANVLAANLTVSNWSTLAFFHLALTWDNTKGTVALYLNGVLAGSIATADVWELNNLTKAVIGAYAAAASDVWYGYLAHAVAINRPLTQAEITEVSRV